MSFLEIIYQAIAEAPEFQALVGDRFEQSTAVNTAPAQKPFALYTAGISGPFGPYPVRAREETFQLWAHDEPGDYTSVNEVLDSVKLTLMNELPQIGFLEFRWLGRSPDLYDPALGTICRFDRWQAIGF